MGRGGEGKKRWKINVWYKVICFTFHRTNEKYYYRRILLELLLENDWTNSYNYLYVIYYSFIIFIIYLFIYYNYRLQRFDASFLKIVTIDSFISKFNLPIYSFNVSSIRKSHERIYEKMEKKKKNMYLILFPNGVILILYRIMPFIKIINSNGYCT